MFESPLPDFNLVSPDEQISAKKRLHILTSMCDKRYRLFEKKLEQPRLLCRVFSYMGDIGFSWKIKVLFFYSPISLTCQTCCTPSVYKLQWHFVFW